MADERYPGAAPPPPGITPDLDHPEDSGRTLLLGWLIACNALALIFFVVRAYSQVWMRHRILLEDITCAISWVSIHLYSATVAMMIHYGEGYHVWEVSPHDYWQITRWLYASSIIYCPAAYFTKVTLLLVIARVFTVHERVAKAIRIFIIVLLVAYLPIQILKTIICLPIRAFWDKSVRGKCLKQARIFIADISLAILTDLIILLIPIVLIWPLRASPRKKLKMVVMLGAGGVAVGVTSYRLYAVIAYLHSTDVTSDFVEQGISVMIELTVGLVCSCFPAANMAMTRYRDARPSASNDSSPSNWTWPPIKQCCDVITRRTRGTDSHETGAPLGPIGNGPAEEAARGWWTVDLDRQYSPRLTSLTSERGVREGWLAKDSESRDVPDALSVVGVSATSGVGGSELGDRIWDGGVSQVDLATALRSRPPDS